MGIAVGFHTTLNLNKIGLVEQCLVAMAICSPLVWALEICTLGQETLSQQALFLHYYLHALK
jgi:hypothetical protein